MARIEAVFSPIEGSPLPAACATVETGPKKKRQKR